MKISKYLNNTIFHILGFAVLVAIIAGFSVAQLQFSIISSQKDSELGAIAQSKVEQITSWRNEEIKYATVFLQNSNYIAAAKKLLKKKINVADRNEFADLSVSMIGQHHYIDVILAKNDGQVVFSNVITTEALDNVTIELIKKAYESNSSMLCDLHANQAGQPLLDVLVPIKGARGVFVLRIDPSVILYPLVQFWPTPSRSAETLLIRRDGDRILYLNELKNRKNTALILTYPLSATEFPAVQAALGKEGLLTGRDYAGNKVVAIARHIPGTTWIMVAKIDASEVYASVYWNTFIITFIAFGVCLSIYMSLVYLLRRRSEMTIYSEKERFQTIIQSIGDGLIVTDCDGKVTLINKTAEQLTGWKAREAINLPLEEIFHIIAEKDRGLRPNPVREALKENKTVMLANHTLLISKNGDECNIADSAAPIHDMQGKVIGAVLIFRDVTEITRANDEVKNKYEELDRLRLAMLNVNEDLHTNLESLQKSQALSSHLASIVESSDDAIVSKRLDGTILSWNKGAEKLYGYSAKEAIGQLVSIVIPVDKLSESLELMQKISSGWHIEHYETQRITKNKSMIDVSISLSPIYDSSKKVVGISVISRDITEQKKTNNELAFKSALLAAQTEAALDGILVVSTDGRTLFANQRFAKMWNIAPEIMDQKNDPKMIEYILHQLKEPDKFAEKVDFLYKHPNESSIDEVHFKDGKVFERYSSPLPKIEGHDFGRVWYFRDITEKKQAENEIKNKNAELEKLYQIKNDFTSTVSHELRTPLTSIKEGIGIVLDGTAGPVNAEQKEFLAIAKRNVDRLHHLINDVLAIQKLEAGKMTFNIQLGNILAATKDAIEGQNLAALEKGLAIKLEQNGEIPAIYFDVDQVMLVLNNYLSNAIKFTDQGGITVKIMPDSWNHGVKIGVFDSGIGISPEDIPKLFQRYQQLGGVANRKTGGTGLGLALSKEIVEKMQGKVWVESEIGKGSAFWFTLPGIK